MANYLSGGVFIEERSAGNRSISSVSSSTLGIIGFSLRGASDSAIVFDSYDEFERKAGGLIKTAETAYQVKAFFDNGGAHGYFSRAIGTASVAANFQVATSLATAASIKGSADHAGGIVTVAGGLTNIQITIDTLYVADNIDVTGGNGNGSYPIQTICNNINAALVSLFGAAFQNVATVDAGSVVGTSAIRLTSISRGASSNVAAAAATSNSGLASIYGGAASASGSAASGNTFLVQAQYVGEDGNNIAISASPNPNDISGSVYDLTVYYNGEATEYYEAVSFNYADKDLPTYYKTQIENSSQWIKVTEASVLSGVLVPFTPSTTSVSIGTGNKSLTVATGLAIVVGQKVLIKNNALNTMGGSVVSYDSGTGALVVNVTSYSGSGTLAVWTVYLGLGMTSLASGHEAISNGDVVANVDKGIALMNAIQNFDTVKEILNLVCPDAENLDASDCKLVQQACAIYYKSTNRAEDVFFIAGTPVSLDDTADMNNVTAYEMNSPVSTDSYTAMYYPPVKIFDTLRRKNRRMSVTGLVAGIYARTDSNKNVGKAPGGTSDGQLNGIASVYRVLTKGQRDTLYQGRVNPIISSPETGQAVWGVRTLSLDSEWRYINARRLFMFCERSVYSAMQFSVFENNGPRLWLILRTTIGSFLQNLFIDGYFAGATESDAYFVICDDTNNPQSQIDAGLVTVDVGIAVSKPAEFVRIRFSQKVKQNQ